ncbi:MAG: hypothetical protein ACTHK0_14530 [Ginsengibacter sp.]
MEYSNEYFAETQRFRQPWLWAIILGVDILFIYAILSEIKKMKSDVQLTLIITTIIAVLLLVLFLILRLETKITGQGIYYRFYPFQLKFKVISWQEVSEAYLRTYKPLWEYGGWGIRFGLRRNGMAYNVSGNQGLQLELANGKRILLGTRRPEEIAHVLIQLNKNSKRTVE